MKSITLFSGSVHARNPIYFTVKDLTHVYRTSAVVSAGAYIDLEVGFLLSPFPLLHRGPHTTIAALSLRHDARTKPC